MPKHSKTSRKQSKRTRSRNHRSRSQKGGMAPIVSKLEVPCNQEPNSAVALSNFSEKSPMTPSEIAGSMRITGMLGGKRYRKRTLKRSSKHRGSKKTGGAYYLDVAAPRVGGQTERTAVFDEIPPIGYPEGAKFEYGKPVNAELVGGRRRRSRKQSRKQKGGAAGGEMITTNGVEGVFTDKMMERTFNCSQPEWGPSCI